MRALLDDSTVVAMRELAQSVVDGKPRSYVEAARVLARFTIDAFPAPDDTAGQACTVDWAVR